MTKLYLHPKAIGDKVSSFFDSSPEESGWTFRCHYRNGTWYVRRWDSTQSDSIASQEVSDTLFEALKNEENAEVDL